MLEMFMNMAQNMDAEQAESMLNEIDDEQLEEVMTTVVDKFVVPHLHDIRQRAQEDDRQAARAHYESMSEQEQQQEFFAAAADLASVLQQCRYQPREGFLELKERLRDPWTVEALMLFFTTDDDTIDDEYEQEMKRFATTHLRFFGLHVMPEIYSKSEAVDLLRTVYDISDAEAEEMLSEFGGQHW